MLWAMVRKAMLFHMDANFYDELGSGGGGASQLSCARILR